MEQTRKTYSDYGIEIPRNKRGGDVKTFCPNCHNLRHDKRDKSLSVNLDKGVWHCHYCGWSGGLGINREETAWRNPLPLRHEQKTYTMPKPDPRSHEVGQRAMAWFNKRGISAETVKALRVGEGMEWMPQKQGEANTIQFNYYLNGDRVNTKYRTGDKCFKLCSGARLVPWNIDSIKGATECIITEGEMDAMSFWEAGYRHVVSVPNGANANLDYLDDFIDTHFGDKKTIYIASDTDTKGVLLRDELLRRFGPERCRVVDYGPGCKDANELLMAHGVEALRDAVKASPETKLEGVFTIRDFEDSLDALFEHGLQPGVSIGIAAFDQYCTFETKRLLTVTGIPGSGKSEFIDEIAERLNIRYGWKFAYFSPENSPLAYHASKLISKFTGKPFERGVMTEGEYRQVKEHLEENFFFISPEDYKLGTILEKGRQLVRRKGIKALVIDPYNRLEDESGGESETRYISKQLDAMTNFAQQEDVLVILMAHPRKMDKDQNGDDKVPTLYDISGSANFFNKTDFGLVVHRDRRSGKVIVRIDKVKFRHLGEKGECELEYNRENGRYSPYSETLDHQPIHSFDNTNHLQVQQQQVDVSQAANQPNFDFMEFKQPFTEAPF